MTTQELVNALFITSAAGPVRSKVFATVYEELWRGYLPSLGFKPALGKPQIHWRDVAPPANLRDPNWSRLGHALELKRSASHGYPDGLLYRDEAAYVWEAKHWIPELFSGTRSFSRHVWDFAWLLARQAVYKAKPFQIAGFVISWWRDEKRMRGSSPRRHAPPESSRHAVSDSLVGMRVVECRGRRVQSPDQISRRPEA